MFRLNLDQCPIPDMRYAGGEDRSRTDLDGFAGRCITALLPRQRICCTRDAGGYAPHRQGKNGSSWNSGAGEEARTLDLNLGKVALYQLSYSRWGVLRYYAICKTLEREKRLELSTSTLARLRSTN
jgi:hypothetical protein